MIHVFPQPKKFFYQLSNEKISSVEKIFYDIGVIIEVPDKKGMDNFNEFKTIRISK